MPENNPAGDTPAEQTPQQQQVGVETPSTQGVAQPQPAAEGDIHDPAAYHRAQAEKYERLFKKADERAGSLEARIKSLQDEQAAAIRQEIGELRTEMETQKAEAEKARVEAQRVTALAKKELPPDLAKFITATDEEGIKAQVDELAGHVTPQRGRSPIGNAAGDRSKRDLSWLPGHPDHKGDENLFGNGGVGEIIIKGE